MLSKITEDALQKNIRCNHVWQTVPFAIECILRHVETGFQDPFLKSSINRSMLILKTCKYLYQYIEMYKSNNEGSYPDSITAPLLQKIGDFLETIPEHQEYSRTPHNRPHVADDLSDEELEEVLDNHDEPIIPEPLERTTCKQGIMEFLAAMHPETRQHSPKPRMHWLSFWV